jgi:hypothetical protein
MNKRKLAEYEINFAPHCDNSSTSAGLDDDAGDGIDEIRLNPDDSMDVSGHHDVDDRMDMRGQNFDGTVAMRGVESVPSNLHEAGIELEKLREELKTQYLNNPHLDLREPDEKLTMIDTMTAEQLNLLKLQVQTQTASLVDDGLIHRVLASLANIFPMVCKETLKESIQDDELLHTCMKTLVGTTLTNLPPKYKFAFLLGSHVLHAASILRQKQLGITDPYIAQAKRQKTAAETPFPDDNQRS